MKICLSIPLALLLITLNSQFSTAFAQGTAFSYQGRLNDGGSPAMGIYDLRFAIYDAVTNGSVVAGPLTNSATGVTNGLFAVTLDFGTGVFTGAARWLEVDVRTNGGGAFTPLLPLQPIQPVPFAIMANTASNLLGALPAAQLSGIIPLAQLPGAVLTNLTAAVATNAPNGMPLNGLSLLVQNQTVYGQNTADGNGVLTNTTIRFLTSPWSNLTNGVFTAFFTNTVSLSPIVWFSNPQDPTNFVAYDKNTVLVGMPILLDTTTNDSTGATAFALASNPMTIWYDSNFDPLPGLFSYVNVSYFELSVTTPLIVTNTQPGSGNSSLGTILGVADSYYTNSMIWGETLFVSPGQYWSGNMDSYAGYFSNFNSTVAAYSGSPLGQYGLNHYIWNHYIGSTRASVSVENAFGTNGYFGDIIEFLPLKAQEANIASGLFAHPIRLDGYGRVQVGNIPEANHGRFYPAAGFLDVVAGTNTDTPAMILSSETLTLTTVPGAIERSGGKLYFTDDNSNRAAIFTGSNASGLTCLSASAITGGFNTNILVGGHTLYITNGIIMNVQ